ncbi:hypothetical protein [Actinomadura sp. 3N508]|uniref:hypothetical protein n=1 Tax=Actinomadura sp. 3N508 TaxID=3375153 RepID=UPI0037A3A2AC
MTALYVLDVPEFAPLADAATAETPITRTRVGPYLKVAADGEIVIGRAATSFRDAVWFSVLGGGYDGDLLRYDADEIRIAPAHR